MSASSDSIFVIDTSSVIQIKQLVPQAQRKAVFASLTEYVEKELLLFPKEVLIELEKGSPDQPYAWAKQNCDKASKHGHLFEELRYVLAHPQAKRVLDPDKVGTVEADPHVLALALYLKKNGASPVVVNDETKSRPTKLSLTQACGALRLVPITVEIFLAQEGIFS